MEEDFPKRLEEAVLSIRSKSDRNPPVGLVLGSGFGSFVESVEGTDIPYQEIGGFPVPTVEGHAGFLRLGPSVAVVAGRFHHYEGWSMDDIVLPVFLLHALGVRTLIVTNAAGGINRGYSVGELVLIKDHINLIGVNPLRGPNPAGFGPRFPDMTESYSRKLREMAREVVAALEAGGRLQEGVYAAFAGPTYETPAEVRMAEVLGADLVGMSTVPDVIAARYLGMEVLGLSMVTNMAAGILDKPLSHKEVLETAAQAVPRLSVLLQGILSRLVRP
ncbi:MAG: purine-nucleoside phosphorylase [Spirochaetaceae bacterium]|nr:MAG: purine-nucleoside phosphorylase [Spirochaetaceae bacterium]